MNLLSKTTRILGFTYLTTQSLVGGLISSTPSMEEYQAGAEKLTVYTDVPGHGTSMINGYASRAKSDIYEIWVRSAASNNVWVPCFANMTYNRGLEMPELTGFGTPTAKHAYQRHTSGWTHTYANIEMSENSPVEVEIRKISNTTLNGSTGIVKSAIHPAHKIISGSKKDENGRVYFKIDQPCQIVIDINGQMDDHNAAYPSTTSGGRMPDGSPVHSVAFYANPIMAKPVASPTNTILTVNPADSSSATRLAPPDPTSYDTLIFAPGIHNIGASFKLYPGKTYYIPGDAIVYGNIGNQGVSATGYRCNGDTIKIFGYGTICGIQVPHYQNTTDDDTPAGTPNPEYPEWHAWVGEKSQGVGIEIEGAWDTTITGVTTIDPANFNTKFDVFSGRTNDQSLVNWVKLHSWRVNGDGFGGYAPVEDSFFRTSDDSTYVRDWRRRCTFWKDTNANIFRFVNYKSGGLDDCDVIYSRWRDTRGVGSVFEFADGASPQPQVLDLNLTIKNIRFHDKLSNPSRLFNMNIIESFRGLVFENISAYLPKNGNKSILKGSELAPWYELLVFKNVSFKTSEQGQYDTGTVLSAANFNDYFETNEYVNHLLFDNPLDLTLTLNADAQRGLITKSPSQSIHLETTTVVLTAIAKPSFVFTNWTGVEPAEATTNPLTIRMLDDRTITANFGIANIANPVVIDNPSSGTWAVPPGVYSATFEAWSGGGAGGSSYHRAGTVDDPIISSTIARGGGGAGGSYSRNTLRVTPGQVIGYGVGNGGTATAIGFVNGSDGASGEVSFANLNSVSILLAQGGSGGKNTVAFNSNSGGSGGLAPISGNVGEVSYFGGNGGGSSSNGTGGGGGSAGGEGGGAAASGAAGGTAGLGGGAGGASGVNGFTGIGISGNIPGGGGSGGMVRNVDLNQQEAYRAGGNGGDGRMIVTYNTLPVNLSLTTQAVNGSILLSPSGATHLAGTTVSVTAVADANYRFSGWSDALTGSTNPTTVLMDDDKTLTASFIPVYALTITNSPNGSIALSPPGGTYDSGTVVTVTATADPGYAFDGWSGALAGFANPATFTMDGHKSISANFKVAVTINNPGVATWIVPPGVNQITLQAWGGGGAGGSAYSGVATSNTQARGGGGAGGAYARASASVIPGQVIHYTLGSGGIGAVAGFSHLSQGNAGGTTSADFGGNPIVSALGGPGGVNISITNALVSGTGGQAPQTGNTGEVSFYGGNGATGNSNGTGGGGGSAGSQGNGGNAPIPATGSFAPGGTLGLGGGATGGTGHNGTNPGNLGGSPGAGGSGAAVRNPSTNFPNQNNHRTGGTGGNGQLIITYNILPIEELTLTTAAVNGAITLSPAGGTYAVGTEVTLTAVPASGYRFIGWSGDLTGSTNATTLAMNTNQSVTAVFDLILPILSCRRSAGDIVISWPRAFPGWKLEWSNSLGPDSVWAELALPSENEAEFFWQEQTSDDRRFFRLRYP